MPRDVIVDLVRVELCLHRLLDSKAQSLLEVTYSFCENILTSDRLYSRWMSSRAGRPGKRRPTPSVVPSAAWGNLMTPSLGWPRRMAMSQRTTDERV